MANQNLDIVVRVRGGSVASQEIKQVGDATKGVGTAADTTSKKTSGLSRTMKGLASGFAVYKGAAFIKDAVSTTTDLAKATGSLKRVTGLDTQQAVGWVEMAKQRGLGSKQLNQGFITLNKNIYAATHGSKGAQQAFGAMGLDAMALKVLPANLRMGQLADTFKAMPAGVDKAALAQKLFGRGAQSMLPILNQSSLKLGQQVDQFGKATGMTDSSMKASLEYVKTQRQMQSAMTGVKVAVATALLPVLLSISQAITPVAQAFSRAMQTSSGFRYAVLILSGAIAAFVAIMAIANITMLPITGTIGLVIAAVVGLGIALVLAYKHIGWFRDAVNAMAHAAVSAFNWLKQAAINTFNWIKANWPLLVSILGGPLGAAAVQIARHWNQIKSGAQTVWSFLRGLGAFVGGAFSGAWNTAASAVRAVSSAIGDVVNAAKTAASLPGKAGGLISKGLGAAGSVVGLAAGGTITHGGVAVVGEAGPELVNLPTGSSVIPNHALAAGTSGNITVPVYLDSRQIALAMADFTADQQASR